MTAIEWKPFEIADWPWVIALHIEQERMLGRQMDLPNLMERPVISAYVGRRQGAIVACVFAEAEIEVCALAGIPLAKADIESVTALLVRDAQFYQIRLARAFVPKQAPRAVYRILTSAGFQESNETMTDFYRWIPQSADREES